MEIKVKTREQIINEILDKYGSNIPSNLKKFISELTKED